MSPTIGRTRCAYRFVAGCNLVEVPPVNLGRRARATSLLRKGNLIFLAKELRVEDILDANPDPGRLVGVTRPLPRRVVPICNLPRRRSDAWSIAMCQGMIRCALPDKTTTEVSMPRDSRSSSSAIKNRGRRHSRHR